MITDFFEPFRRLRRASRSDGLGGSVEAWEEGEAFDGGVTHVPGAEISVAGRRALRSVPVLVHETSVGFQQDELVRRLSDGAVFRVAGRSDQMRTPIRASVRFAQVPVEVVVIATTRPEDSPQGDRTAAVSAADWQGWPNEVVAMAATRPEDSPQGDRTAAVSAVTEALGGREAGADA